MSAFFIFLISLISIAIGYFLHELLSQLSGSGSDLSIESLKKKFTELKNVDYKAKFNQAKEKASALKEKSKDTDYKAKAGDAKESVLSGLSSILTKASNAVDNAKKKEEPEPQEEKKES
jgi:hypothetical protein